MTTDALFILNAGSSSLKFRLFQVADSLPLLAEGRITGLGSRPEFTLDGDTRPLPPETGQAEALAEILRWTQTHAGDWRIRAIGHRIVHGGEHFSAPTRLDETTLTQLDALIPLAPLHQPHALSAVRGLASLFPDAVQIGCFDTAFHAGHSDLFRYYALPKKWRESGIRRYGFHGLSYDWLSRQLAEKHPRLASGRVVAAHLGNGSSLCALQNGRSIDTTMGMTALEGLPMGTRSGGIDPGVLLYMMRQLRMEGDAIEHLLSYESGLKGLSGISGDMRELLASPHPDARFAVEYYTLMTAQHIARMATAIGGMDALVFTGGIGEHAAPVREAILRHLAWLPDFETHIIPADEERLIAAYCLPYLKEFSA